MRERGEHWMPICRYSDSQFSKVASTKSPVPIIGASRFARRSRVGVVCRCTSPHQRSPSRQRTAGTSRDTRAATAAVQHGGCVVRSAAAVLYVAPSARNRQRDRAHLTVKRTSKLTVVEGYERLCRGNSPKRTLQARSRSSGGGKRWIGPNRRLRCL